VRGRWHADAGDGCWHHGSWLDRPGTAVVSCPAAALDTLQATWASLTCAATPHGAVVRRPRLAAGLPLSARQGRGHRGRRPDHADQGRTLELVRASSASCLDKRGAVRSRTLRRESTARPKLPPERPVAPPGRSLSQNAGTTGTEGQAGTRLSAPGCSPPDPQK
jgi:hypothetical protein